EAFPTRQHHFSVWRELLRSSLSSLPRRTAMPQTLRIGLIGAGANTRSRHIPGLRALPGVEIVAVCNRRPASTAAVAREFGIPRTYERWQDLVADRDLNAVVVGTWPYLHAPITAAALAAGRHVLTQSRMCL